MRKLTKESKFTPNNKVIHQLLVAGLQTVPSTNFSNGQLHHNLRISFGIHLEVLHEFSIITLSEPILHSSRSSGQFSTISNLSNVTIFGLRVQFSREDIDTCHVLNNSCNSLLLRSLASFPRYQSKTTPM